MSKNNCVNLPSPIGCERASEMIYEYIDGTLSEKEKSAIEAHIENCDKCRNELEMRREFLSALRESGRLTPKRDILSAVLSDPEVMKLSEQRRAAAENGNAAGGKILPVKLNRITRYLAPVAAAIVLVSGITLSMPYLQSKNMIGIDNAEMAPEVMQKTANDSSIMYSMCDATKSATGSEAGTAVNNVSDTVISTNDYESIEKNANEEEYFAIDGSSEQANDKGCDETSADQESYMNDKLFTVTEAAAETEAAYRLPQPLTEAPEIEIDQSAFDPAETGTPSTGISTDPVAVPMECGIRGMSIQKLPEFNSGNRELDSEYQNYHDNTVEFMVISKMCDDEEYEPIKIFKSDCFTVYIYKYSTELEDMLINNAEMQNASFITERSSGDGIYMTVYVKNE